VKRLLVLLGAVVCLTAAAEEKPKSVTLDVKDADVRVILKSMQKQCGIKNLLIDKDVQGAGTILFREVPCENAFRVVMMQFGLTGQIEPNIVVVEPRKH
jgi:type II secretory pathway component HofQ